MIKSSNLSFRYPEAKADTLSNLNFSVSKGEVVCLLGSNGSGKSTLLTLLAGLYTNFQGGLRIGGYDSGREQKQVRGLCALVPQNPDLYLLGSTLREDMCLGLPYKRADRQIGLQIGQLCEALGLSGLEDVPIHTLSFGQRRKASLASALMRNPSLLLLDEPFSGLDYDAQLYLRQMIIETRQQNITQVMATHDLDMAGDLADGFILLKDGMLLAQGGQEAVFPRLSQANVRPPCWWLHGETRPQFI